jgi:hypothetical protein
MNATRLSATRIAAGLAFLALFGCGFLAGAEAPGRAEVRALHGQATFTIQGGPTRPLTINTILLSGTVIKTGPDSTVDLFLGQAVGTVRISENSTLALDKLAFTDTGADTAVDVQLHLPDGEMYFNVNKLSRASRYEIKLPTGVAGIRGTKGSFCFRQAGRTTRPPVVLLEGKIVFVHVPGAGAIQSYVMSAPPAVYFNATDGVKEAPLSLTKEVEHQLDESDKAPRKKDEPPVNTKPPFSLQPEPVLSPGSGVPSKR